MAHLVVGLGFGILGLAIGALFVHWFGDRPVKPFAADDSPVTVRGGSMRARSKTAWQPTNTAGSSPATFCTNANAPILHIVVDDPKNPESTTSVTANWEVQVDGRDPTGKSLSGRGIDLKPVASCLSSTTNPVALTVLPDPNGTSDFYPPNSGIDEDGTNSERFEDETPDNPSPGARGCAGPSGKFNGDEDVCESPYQVIVIPDTTKPAQFTKILCTNGECTVHFSKH
jgi:hypothetical protein